MTTKINFFLRELKKLFFLQLTFPVNCRSARKKAERHRPYKHILYSRNFSSAKNFVKRVATVQWFDKKSGAYYTSFNHQWLTKRPSQTQKCMQIKGMKISENESTHYVTIISARNTGTSTIFWTVFNQLPLEDFSQTNGNLLVGAQRAHFRKKLKINKQPGLLESIKSSQTTTKDRARTRDFIPSSMVLGRANVRTYKLY